MQKPQDLLQYLPILIQSSSHFPHATCSSHVNSGGSRSQHSLTGLQSGAFGAGGGDLGSRTEFNLTTCPLHESLVSRTGSSLTRKPYDRLPDTVTRSPVSEARVWEPPENPTRSGEMWYLITSAKSMARALPLRSPLPRLMKAVSVGAKRVTWPGPSRVSPRPSSRIALSKRDSSSSSWTVLRTVSTQPRAESTAEALAVLEGLLKKASHTPVSEGEGGTASPSPSTKADQVNVSSPLSLGDEGEPQSHSSC
mmetsp:Transcript_13377/g.37554  ORF Transcript_13377/g.37554 Transcript_13377/m.37554 type:complete len:252 (+) Transcript_13377:2263-3018(+)